MGDYKNLLPVTKMAAQPKLDRLNITLKSKSSARLMEKQTRTK